MPLFFIDLSRVTGASRNLPETACVLFKKKRATIYVKSKMVKTTEGVKNFCMSDVHEKVNGIALKRGAFSLL